MVQGGYGMGGKGGTADRRPGERAAGRDRAGYVGRYRLYRPVDVHSTHARLKLYRQGCIAANISAQTIYGSFHRLVRNLPTLTCKPPKHVTAYVLTAGINELSPAMTSHAIVYGHASRQMWLTVAQTASTTCKSDPLAYSQAQRHAKIWLTWHVKRGEFEEGFRTKALIPEGRFCIYLQTGAQYDHFPDGWIVRDEYNDYATGDVLTGSASTALGAAASTSVTLSGQAPRTETLKSYDSLTPCPEYSELAGGHRFRRLDDPGERRVHGEAHDRAVHPVRLHMQLPGQRLHHGRDVNRPGVSSRNPVQGPI